MATDLTKIANAMFNDRSKWENITEKEKEDSFFIINRYLTKIYPEYSILLNNKSFENYKSIGMDIWFNFFKNKPYPNLIWSKSNTSYKKIDKDFEKYKKRISEYYNIEINDTYDFYINNIELVKDDIEYFKKIDNIK